MKIVNSLEMKSIENQVIEKYGFSEQLIIENVGLRGADYLQKNLLQDKSYGEIVLLLGKGNNGSDALCIGRHLARAGQSVRGFLLFPVDECTDEFKYQLKMAKAFGVRISEIKDADQMASYFEEAQDSYFIIDAIFGTGVRLPLSNFVYDVINVVNDHSSFTVSIDIPTGVCGDSGAVNGNAIKANLTLAIALPKVGYYMGDGPRYIGKVEVIDGGFPSELLGNGNKILLTPENVSHIFGKRNKFAHKNSFGHALVLGGSPGLVGALILASSAAMKAGAGLVTATTWEKSYRELYSRMTPEIMTGMIPTEVKVIEKALTRLDRYSSVIIGPGLGRSDKTRDCVLEILKYFEGPVVIDADAINVLNLKEDDKILLMRRWPTLLTPHIGEFERFTGKSKEEILQKPIICIREAIERTNCSFLLKGPSSYLGFPTGEIFISYFPNDGMATGGSGDVLAGLIGGLLAQNIKQEGLEDNKGNIEFYKAICLGLVVHSLAGKYAAAKWGSRSMSAKNLVEHIHEGFAEIDLLSKQQSK